MLNYNSFIKLCGEKDNVQWRCLYSLIFPLARVLESSFTKKRLNAA